MKTYEQYIRVGESGEPELYPFEYLDFYETHAHPYHEFMLEFFQRHPYMWANYVWNMFDFAADL
mgnify:CR=1 FL=1